MRINKYIAEHLGISRRKADDFIANGRILVNGTAPNPGQDVTDADVILVDSKSLPNKKTTETIILNKPAGYVCSRNGQGSHTIYELLPSSLGHLNPVGRLDKDSSGLILLTNDGELHQKLTHPSYEKQKIYQVIINKPLDVEHKKQIEEGIMLTDGISKLQLNLWQRDGRGWLVCMHEGRNRQIRRTFGTLGYRVISLNRTQFGDYKIDNLPIGKYFEAANT